MSAPTVSPRTIIRDTIIRALETRKNQSLSRIQSFAVSPRYLTEQETKQSNTYCVIVTDEGFQAVTHGRHDANLTVKLVLYAYDTKDPRVPLDAMIEDSYDVMSGLQQHPDMQDKIWQVMPESITTDEATTAAGPWAQALCQWSLQHRRS